MKSIHLKLLLVLIFSTFNVSADPPVATNTIAPASAPANPIDATAQIQAQIDNPPEATSKNEIATRGGSPEKNCTDTKTKAIKECMKPSGQGFKSALQLGLSLPGIAMGFMSGGDPKQMADMCKMNAVATTLSTMLGGTMKNTCGNGAAACQEVCEESADFYKKEIYKVRQLEPYPRQNNDIENLKMRIAEIEKEGNECVSKVSQIQAQNQGQQQANQMPTQSLADCDALLDENGDGIADEDQTGAIDCALAENASNSECATLSKASDGNTIGFDNTDSVLPGDQASELDMPLGPDEEREKFWQDLKNKTSGAGAGNAGGAGMGAMGGFGGGSGAGAGANGQKAGGAGRKGSASFLGKASGGGGSGGGSSGGYGSGSDFDSKLAGLSKKKGDLNMLTKKKLGGRGIASSEFGLASDDIWTRLYLRTNTRCTKQLVECAANKSLSPYGAGANSANKAR